MANEYLFRYWPRKRARCRYRKAIRNPIPGHDATGRLDAKALTSHVTAASRWKEVDASRVAPESAGRRHQIDFGWLPSASCNVGYQEIVSMRCPYLEQILKKKQAVLKVFQADCHVDRKVHRFWGVFTWPTPPCIGKPMTCVLYQEARASEDLRLRRYTD